MAEVLVTLAIIGVVAALTIPSVVAKYQKQQYYTQFMKMYNTLSNVFQMVEQDYGKLDQWGLVGAKTNDDDINKAVSILKEYLKTGAEPTSLDGVSGVKALGYTNEQISYLDYLSSFKHIVLADGSIVFILQASNGSLFLHFDSNGIKEPNTVGRDIFVFSYNKEKGFHPDVEYEGEGKKFCDSENPSGEEDSGMACASRLLLEGKMNY